jgi:DNA-binding transcriptional MerR regulator
MMNKTDQAYKTIGEVTKILNIKNRSGQKIPTHTIRFWEKNFKQIKPKILNGNRRYYDKKNVDLLKKIKYLLKDQGMTINGVKKLLDSGQSNQLDEILNKSISADNLRNKLSNISRIIKKLKDLK